MILPPFPGEAESAARASASRAAAGQFWRDVLAGFPRCHRPRVKDPASLAVEAAAVKRARRRDRNRLSHGFVASFEVAKPEASQVSG